MNVNIVKALLVFLVIIDHNNLSREYIGGFLSGFTFHVVGFFVLYLMSSENNKQDLVGIWSKQGVRYFYPYFLFVIILSIITFFLTHPDLYLHVLTTLKALYSGNHVFLKQSTNMYLLWFLPAFFSFIIIDFVYKKFSKNHSLLINIILLGAFIVIPFIPKTVLELLPLSFFTALYLMFIAVLTKVIYLRSCSLMSETNMMLLSLISFSLIKYAQIALGSDQEIGFLQLATIQTPILFIVNLLESITGVLLVFSIASLNNIPSFLCIMGRYSMQVYLLHAFIAVAIGGILKLVFSDGGWSIWIISALLTAILTTWISSILMKNSIVLRYIFPKDFISLLYGNK